MTSDDTGGSRPPAADGRPASVGAEDPAGAGGAEAREAETEEGAPSGAPRAERTRGRRGRRSKSGSFWRELPILILVALGLALVIKTWVVQAFFIPSQSMENTLLVGDRVLVNKFIHHFRDIERGEVIVFNGTDSWDEPAPAAEAPGDPVSAALRWVGETFGVVPTGRDYIKRVVGVPGDVVACCDDQGRVTVNGAALDEEEYLFPGDAPSQEPFGPVTVGAGQYWVMGDHRSISYDSRRHQNDPGGGTIPEERVLGSAFVIVWPFERWTVLAAPGTFEQTALAAPGHVAAATPLGLGLAGAVPLTLAGRAAVRRWRAGIERRSSDR